MSSRTMVQACAQHIGKIVTVQGWVHNRRDMGNVVFVDLRDRSGLLQVVCLFPELTEIAQQILPTLRSEYCVGITGIVKERSASQINPKLETGKIELLANEIVVYNPSKTPPFDLTSDTSVVSEELRLKHRYLDLRSARMIRNMQLRDRVISFIRDFLHHESFLEIETPYLTKGTPEGAREFLVPSRLHPRMTYVLPQSPQQFKQLLMVAGVEKYFQIARCFRDEDQRGDRQPEFTQLDLEMSFVEQEDVLQLIERMMIALVQTVTPEKRIQQIPFPRLTFQEAMDRYQSDKPDLREDKQDPHLLAFGWILDFPFFECTDDGGWTFSHNPFSAPKPGHLSWLLEKSHIGEILTTQYDIVLNGYEIGGGSIRNHTPEALRTVLEILGYSSEEIHDQFGHMLEAFAYGAPPHGGIAPGIDRIVMLLANEPNIREVIPIPKTGDARDLMMGAPSSMSDRRLKEVHIQWRPL